MRERLLPPQFSAAPISWKLLPLKRLMRVNSGAEVLVEVPLKDGAVPVYGSGIRPFKYTDRSISDEAAVIFGRKGTLGLPYLLEPPFWVVDTAYIATPRQNVELAYLYFILQVFDWRPFITNTAKPSLVANDILSESVPLPRREEQIHLLGYLSQKIAEIDEVVAGLREQRVLLERYKRELIAHTVTNGLDPDVPMKDSGVDWIGNVPEEWSLLRISALYDLRSQKVSDIDYPPLSVTMNGIVPQLETVAKTNDGDNRKLVRAGDFVINSRSDRRGACGISPQDGSCSLINVVLSPQSSIHNPYFSYLFRSSRFSDEFYRWGHGIHNDLWTTNWNDMRSIQVPVPPIREQALIADYLDGKTREVDGLVADIDRQIELLGRYRKQAINDVVTGKVRVCGEVA